MEEKKSNQTPETAPETNTPPAEPTLAHEAPETSGDDALKMPEESFSAIPEMSEDKTAHLGAILGILIVILVLILAGLYLWGMTMTEEPYVEEAPVVTRPAPEENNEPESTNAEAEVETMGALSTSNSIEAIEADLESTDLDSLDAELDTIDSELEATTQ